MQYKIRVPIFPLPGLELSGEYKIADHINLSGKGVRETGFVPVTDLYVHKKDPEAIIVACIKPLTTPTAAELEILKKNGVKAYSYQLIEPALYAAANGQTVEAIGYIPQLPSGFALTGITAGIKESKRKDLGVIHSEKECIWAGVFTKNLVKAACVTNNQTKLGEKIKSIFVNSGCANACTGKQGSDDDLAIAELLSVKLGGKTLTASTGKIGLLLNMDVVRAGINDLALDPSAAPRDDGIINFAEAILTTDLRIKISQDSKRNILGFTKGSGMIHPNMATMLGFMISDACIKGLDEKAQQKFFQEALLEITEKTFNSISVDGDTSTNDMVIFASNLSGREISQEEFKASLEEVSRDLALQIVQDGEGTTKIIEAKVSGSLAETELRKIAKGIIGSNLVKSAIFGCDPNWGRIISAAGQAAAENKISLNPATTSLKILGSEVFNAGTPTNQDKRSELITKMKKNKYILLELNLDSKPSNTVTVWGSDLSYDYVRINAEYFT